MDTPAPDRISVTIDGRTSEAPAGTTILEAAKTLVDWSITEDANRMYNEGYAVIGIMELAKPVAGAARSPRATNPATRTVTARHRALLACRPCLSLRQNIMDIPPCGRRQRPVRAAAGETAAALETRRRQ